MGLKAFELVKAKTRPPVIMVSYKDNERRGLIPAGSNYLSPTCQCWAKIIGVKKLVKFFEQKL